MKKVVMVTGPVHPVPPKRGAAVEWWMHQVSRRLRQFEPHIISIATPDHPVEELRDGIHFHRISIGRFYKRLFQKITRLDPYSYAHRAARIIDAIQPDIVHVHNAPNVFRQIHRLSRWQGARYILHMQNEMAVNALADDESLITCSRYLNDWYAKQLPGAAIRVVTNGVDVSLYRPTWSIGPERNEFRRRFHVPEERKLILYVGRISPEKGPLELVHAFRELRKIRQDVYLLVVGELRTGDAANRRVRYGTDFAEACASLPGFCRHAGIIDPADVHTIYPMADLVVVPSQFEEPFGMVAIEAMAAGVPVLAANKGGLREFVIPDQTGFLIDDTQDHPRFAQQIHALLDAGAKLDRVRRQARAFVETHHRWEVVADQTESCYRALLGNTATEVRQTYAS